MSTPAKPEPIDDRKPFTCEFGHKQVNKCRQGHPVYAHESRWCCACDADIAFALKWIQEEPEYQRLILTRAISELEEITKGDHKLLNYTSTMSYVDERLAELIKQRDSL